ncbi:MAG: hypothetical protein JWM81_858 [Candidatus Saccharibacteria bacterium]|nr:hypothetical protein [Candidatus Saccharibacteria bacterium]
MSTDLANNPVDYIVPININGLKGRMLKLPAPKGRSREILFLYGSHSSLERMFTLAEELNAYGAVTMPDWPGFGGMDSLFKVGAKPTIDNMADYLATFVKMSYRRRRFTIVGMSYGFAVATRMLQKYPEIAAKVDFIASVVGFAHKDDFHVNKRTLIAFKVGTGVLKHRIPSMIARVVINGLTVDATYSLMANRHSKMKGASREERRTRIEFEKILWRINDLRTYFYTGSTMFTIDLCNSEGNAQVKVPVYHVAVNNDQFFNNQLVEQHLAVIYSKVNMLHVTLTAHMPTIVATAAEVAPFIPKELRKALAAK